MTCPKFVQVNGSLEPASYEIREGDVIETRNFYTVSQVAEFMDLHVDFSHDLFVNNREATPETLVYENFSIEWVELDGPVERVESSSDYQPETEEIKEKESFSKEEENRMPEDKPAMDTTAFSHPDETLQQSYDQPQEDRTHSIFVTVNGEIVELSGKETYIFVDIFDRITFDLNAGRGKAIVTMVNGREAVFTEELHDKDQIELYWK